MLKILKFNVPTFILLLLSVATNSLGASSVGIPKTMNTKTATAAAPIPATFGGSGSTVLSSLQGLSNFAVVNGSSVYEVKVSVKASPTNTCTEQSSENYIVPVSGTTTIEHVAIGKVICLKGWLTSAGTSSGASITYGTVHTMAW